MVYRILCLAACALALGCGKSGRSVPTYVVTGKVTLHGKPLVGAHVNFANKNPDRRSAAATTDAQGRFKLSTYVSPTDLRAGAESGEYNVLISKPVAMAATVMGDGEKMRSASNEERQQMMVKMYRTTMDAQREQKEPPKSEVPDKYSKADSTPLKNITVVNGDNPPFEWDLTD